MTCQFDILIIQSSKLCELVWAHTILHHSLFRLTKIQQKTFVHPQMYRCRPKSKLNGGGFVNISQHAVIYYTNVYFSLLPRGGSYIIYNVHVFPLLFSRRVSLSPAVILHSCLATSAIPRSCFTLSSSSCSSSVILFCSLRRLYDSISATSFGFWVFFTTFRLPSLLLLGCSLRQSVYHP